MRLLLSREIYKKIINLLVALPESVEIQVPGQSPMLVVVSFRQYDKKLTRKVLRLSTFSTIGF